MNAWSLRGPHGVHGSIYIEEPHRRVVGEVWRAPIGGEQRATALLWLHAREMQALLWDALALVPADSPEQVRWIAAASEILSEGGGK
jgi:hypothetical protein